MKTKRQFSAIGDVLKKYKVDDKDKYISAEFQKYGYDLAVELGDLKHKALYIKLAKITPRSHMESARSFVKDAANAKSKARLYMWKLKQLNTKNARKLD